MNKKLLNGLYLQIAGALLLLMLAIGFAYVVITAHSAEMYFQEKCQRMNAPIAQHIVDNVFVEDAAPFKADGTVNEATIKEMASHIMAINPTLEVYLLSTEGTILSHVLPDKRVILNMVNLAPIQAFVKQKGQTCIFGQDPTDPHRDKVFSAAAFREHGEVTAYMYVVFADEKYGSWAQMLFGSYMFRIGVRTMAIALLAAFVLTLILIWFITKNLGIIIETVKQFEQGDLTARIDLQSKGELSVLADNFNHMADTILASIEAMKMTEKLRRELIANVSHDLRTPLAVIHGYMETLIMKDGTLSLEERKNYIEIVLKSTEKLKKLVSELFDLSRLEAKQIQPQKEAFFVHELIQDTYQKYAILAKEKRISFKTHIPQQLPLVLADISMIERVLQNLLDNAIKFTPEGGEVAIQLQEKNGAVEVQISDTGVGISTEEAEYIFDRYRSQSTTPYNNGGTGLGLAIVKKILELHDATIQLQSQVKKGSTFSFELPVTKIAS